ncbi:MAG TPA: hypothetical protein VF169_12115 [Albitalea sp.]|uniref:hypothetical protein n=1 Tax=Piscinibacter sp. TaxID=1903157 RepID=UPI002ED56814
MKRLALLIAPCALLLAACAEIAPNWEANFGQATRQAAAQQVIDPAAPSRNRGPMRADGKAATGSMKAYADSYGYSVKEAKQPEIAIVPPQGGGR